MVKTTRKRYVSFKLHTQGGHVSDKSLTIEIRRNMLSLYGEIWVADSKFYLNEYDKQSGEGILQCDATALDKILTSAVLIGSINGVKVSFEPKKTSGTIKGVRQ